MNIFEGMNGLNELNELQYILKDENKVFEGELIILRYNFNIAVQLFPF